MTNKRFIRKLSSLLITSIFVLGATDPGMAQTSSPALELGAKLTGEKYVRFQEPEFLTFEELKKLYLKPNLDKAFEKKLNDFWKTPVISNEAFYAGARPYRPEDPALGPYLRVVSWNIEKSFHVKDAIKLLTASEIEFQGMVNKGDVPIGSESYQELVRQRKRLRNADILILQEMDRGVKRSQYVDATREIAQALQMNYAYGAEQLEIDPVVLGVEKILLDDGSVDQEATNYYAADTTKYQGIFGSAVLSRYPIKHVEVMQLNSQAYDWYWGEKNHTTFLEKSRRFGSKTVFLNEITREIKRGGRIYFRVDLDIPDVPGGTLSVINIHLEIKCEPKGREAQMAEILYRIKKIEHPLIMAGDFNSAPNDLSPTSITRTTKRIAKNPTTWFSAAVSYVSPHALAINSSRAVSNVTKNFQDPTTKHIPIIAPNSVKGLFDLIQDFRSMDGKAFDFRGDQKRSINGKEGTLANSNQRDFKGFKTSFMVKRPIGPVIGKYRLDWFFVKSFLKNPLDESGPYQLAPHYAETLEELNTSLIQPVSDHHPNVVDIPFNEPKID